LIVRDLPVGPRRYSVLLAGLPGIPTNVLASRSRSWRRTVSWYAKRGPAPDRSVVYRATARAEELRAALDARGRWGAAGWFIRDGMNAPPGTNFEIQVVKLRG
jgi:DNA-binding HxlR family transcriptional regulator